MSFGFRGRHGHRGRGEKTIPGETGGCGRKRTDHHAQCVCPRCGMITEKVPGQPCFLTPCPRCQAMMAARFPPEEQPEQAP